MAPVLVLGVGNPLRRDDGAGPWVAESLADFAPDRIEAVSVHQLTPELAPRLAGRRMVIVVDAMVGGEEIVVRAACPRAGRAGPSHRFGAGDLLSWAVEWSGSAPPCWEVGIPAADLGVGTGLSASTHQHAEAARAWVISKSFEIIANG
jgi:hydrogenase maturation protease